MTVNTYLVKAGFVAGVSSFLQDGTTQKDAIATVHSTGARVISISGPLSDSEILMIKGKRTYIFFNKFGDIYRVTAPSLQAAIKSIPKYFHYEYFEISDNKFSGVSEV
jgi:hypothetical protein